MVHSSKEYNADYCLSKDIQVIYRGSMALWRLGGHLGLGIGVKTSIVMF